MNLFMNISLTLRGGWFNLIVMLAGQPFKQVVALLDISTKCCLCPLGISFSQGLQNCEMLVLVSRFRGWHIFME
jgi:hypothetical protein